MVSNMFNSGFDSVMNTEITRKANFRKPLLWTGYFFPKEEALYRCENAILSTYFCSACRKMIPKTEWMCDTVRIYDTYLIHDNCNCNHLLLVKL